MAKKKITGEKLQIKNAICSFPSVWHKSVYEGKEGNYTCSFLIKKGTAEAKKVFGAYKRIKNSKGVKSDHRCFFLKDGDKSDDPYAKGHWIAKAGSGTRFLVLNPDKTKQLGEGDEYDPYAGCIIDATMFVYYSTTYNCISAGLNAVRFRKHGERIGGVNIDIDEEFDDLTAEELDDIGSGDVGFPEAPEDDDEESLSNADEDEDEDEEEEEEAPKPKKKKSKSKPQPVDEEEDDEETLDDTSGLGDEEEEEEEEAPKPKKKKSTADNGDFPFK